MDKLSFVHLRVHSLYSLGESSNTIKNLSSLAKEYEMPALAITDSNNMFGAREFSGVLSQNGIKPIIGIELSVSLSKDDLKDILGKQNLLEKNYLILKDNNYHNRRETNKIIAPLVLLAKNHNGYLNLLKIHQEIYINRNYNEALNIPLEVICKYSSDLILLTGGNEGFLGQILLQKNNELTKSIVNLLKNKFFENIYIEIQRFPNKNDIYLEDDFLALAQEYNLPIVATANPYFSKKEDFEANDILMCIGQGVVINDVERYQVSKEQYFKSQKEMIKLFQDLPEALENTIKIAQRCNFLVESAPPTLPLYKENIDEIEILKKKAENGLKIKLDKYLLDLQKEQNLTNEQLESLKKEYQDRLNFEVDIITKMNFTGYFLIVADFINWAKSNDIPVGPGRGSGAGSLVAWALNITTINPLHFGLFFERFLNPERISMPDFDIDFCQRGRDEVIKYVEKKYGSDRVAQIITFGSLQTRAALRDVGRALGIPYNSVDKICKRIPYGSPSNPITISKVLKEEKELRKDIEKFYTLNHLFTIALKLENLYRNTSTHAAGVVISYKPLSEIAPLYKDDSEENGLPVVGFSMKYVEEIGLVKFDFLGLKTLTVINGTIKRVKKVQGISIDINNIALKDDKEINKILATGKTLGIFQLESSGMRDVLIQLKPDKIEDIIAIISLYRPGPMENIPVYINRKHGKEEIYNLHPLMDDILKETFGIMIYQEQVMQIAQKLAGYSLGQADLLRRAMGKKKPEEMVEQQSKFISGALANNIPKDLALKIFNQMEKFAGYGFNKSHAAAYAFISWQTAYLKAHYPAEFIAESMTYDMHDVEKLATLIEDVKEFNIKVLPPDINYVDSSFIPFKDEKGNLFIRYSVLAIKGISKCLVEKIKEDLNQKGKFNSIEDFLLRIPSSYLNKRQIEGLIKSGTLDSLDANRGKLLKQVETLLDFNNKAFRKSIDNQVSLFEDLNLESSLKLILKDEPDLPIMEKLIEESSVIGFFISGHPLATVEPYFEQLNIITYNTLIKEKKTYANLAVVVLKTKISKTRNNDRFITLNCSDVSSTFNIILFGKSYNKFSSQVLDGGTYIITVSVKFDNTEAKIFVENLQEFDIQNVNINQDKSLTSKKDPQKNKCALQITILARKDLIIKLRDILESIPKGETPVFLKVIMENGEEKDFNIGKQIMCNDLITTDLKKYAEKVDYLKL